MKLERVKNGDRVWEISSLLDLKLVKWSTASLCFDVGLSIFCLKKKNLEMETERTRNLCTEGWFRTWANEQTHALAPCWIPKPFCLQGTSVRVVLPQPMVHLDCGEEVHCLVNSFNTKQGFGRTP